mmetsp:Transcript_37484/g.57416  ORF Transcript_37484/g.57416 Transcript_37484/m.57416 type:complete len:104 (+) Transcript_37484:4367-4678(+)
MPGGVSEQDMTYLWANKKDDWFSLVTVLMQQQIVQKKMFAFEDSKKEVPRYSLHPFMNFHSTQRNKNKESQHIMILKYFIDVMYQIYIKIDVERFRSEQPELK